MSRWIALVPLALLLPASSAAAPSWSLGTHFGLASIGSGAGSSAGSSTVVAWPTSALTYQPGLRLACGNARHSRDLTLDSGLFLLDEAGSTLSLFVGTASYQHVVRPKWLWSPFADVGLGFYREYAATRTHVSSSYGGGIGVRHAVRDSHGALRAEFRYDHLRDDSASGRPTLITVGLRLGFDLWL
jgi:hypothetical protein